MPAQRISIPIIGGEAISRSVVVNNQETVNFIQSVKGRGAKAPIVLETAPGYVDRGAVGDGPIRTSQMVSSGIRPASTKNDLYGVYGSKLIAHTFDIGNLEIGTLNAGGERVVEARGRNFIMLVDGTDGYTFDGTTFAQITDLDFPGQAGPGKPTHCLYLDGFFIVNDALTDNFFISALEDPTVWNALDFGAAAVAPDAALALAATESILWVLGDETAQAYYNSGNPDFPYDIILNATQEVGILAPYSLAESDDGIFYLATTPEGGRFVYQISGQAGRVITNDEQENFLNTLVDPQDAYAFIYKQAGKSFYVLQVSESTQPPARTSSTLIYNIKAGGWETREINDGTAWRAGGHGVLDNDNIVGSRLQGRFGELDLNNYQDAGAAMIRRRRTQVFHVNYKSIDFWSLELDLEPSPDGTVVLGEAAELKMRYSDDSGRSWSDWLREDLGDIGETQHRVVFDQLGSGRNRVFEFELADAANLTIVAGYAEIELDRD
jgi:hypothetical protein